MQYFTIFIFTVKQEYDDTAPLKLDMGKNDLISGIQGLVLLFLQ